ncbi:MAG TPA: phosphotransferase [Anaerolineae bacterium]|nr:phosphotransferase [Anaerolineae bacterium]
MVAQAGYESNSPNLSMLEKPDFPDENIITCLRSEYGLRVAAITFLPLGADLNTAVYRVTADDGTAYFLKLRSGVFNETSVTLPEFLSDQGVPHIIAPLATSSGQLWATLDAYKVIVYPFIAGRNGYEVDLTDQQWIEFGAVLKRIHSLVLPPMLSDHIQRETYSLRWREMVKAALVRIESETYEDPITAEMTAFLCTKRAEVLALVERTERCARVLLEHSPEFVLCHSDLHAGNILLEDNGAFYLVDWDAPILAPKERDLMYAGGGQFGSTRTPDEEERLFYRGYGQTEIDHTALAYYRYERIVEDIAVECEQIFSTNEGGDDRAQALRWMKSNFEPNGVIKIAYRSPAP